MKILGLAGAGAAAHYRFTKAKPEAQFSVHLSMVSQLQLLLLTSFLLNKDFFKPLVSIISLS